MSGETSPSDLLIWRLSARAPLGPEDCATLRALPFVVRHYDPSGYLVREGQAPVRCALLLDGYAYRQKLTEDGARQIVAVQVPGDLIDLQNLFLRDPIIACRR